MLLIKFTLLNPLTVPSLSATFKNILMVSKVVSESGGRKILLKKVNHQIFVLFVISRREHSVYLNETITFS